MNGFDLNRWMAAFFMVGIFVVGTRLVSEGLYDVKVPHQPVYIVEGAMEALATPNAAPTAPTIEDIMPLMATADADAGKALARKCLQCHGFDEGGKNKVGPNLWHMVGTKIGGASGYNYSKAFKGLEGSWTVDALNKFLAKPRDYAPGTKMSFAGLRKPEDRANLIAYMKKMAP